MSIIIDIFFLFLFYQVLLTFFTLLFSLLYIGLKVPQGTGCIFEKNTQKSPPSQEKSRFVYLHLKATAFSFLLCPCKTFFGTCNVFTKPTDEKGKIVLSAWFTSIRAEPLYYRSYISFILFFYDVDHGG